MSIIYENIAVVGMHFRGADVKALVADMEVETSLRLEREPENKFDINAIKVFFEDTHIGYINREDAVWIAEVLDEGLAAQCTVTSFEERGRNLHPICLIETFEAADV